jgi:hypothetical protein
VGRQQSFVTVPNLRLPDHIEHVVQAVRQTDICSAVVRHGTCDVAQLVDRVTYAAAVEPAESGKLTVSRTSRSLMRHKKPLESVDSRGFPLCAEGDLNPHPLSRTSTSS